MDKIKNKIETVLSLILLVGLALFGYFKITDYLDLNNYNKDLSAAAIEINSEIGDQEDPLAEAKLVFQETNDAKTEEASGVFPAEEDISSLTRAFDEFSVSNNFSNNPFFISNINYKESEEPESGDYMILPITMKIDASESNFQKFLEYIETSGNLDNQIRLMSIEDISINLSNDDEMSFDLEINAYFQK